MLAEFYIKITNLSTKILQFFFIAFNLCCKYISNPHVMNLNHGSRIKGLKYQDMCMGCC